MSQDQNQEICCPQFDPIPWNDQILEWKEKKFIRGRVWTFFFMPINFAGTMRKLDQKLREAGAFSPDQLCLSYHKSKWNMEVLLAVDKTVPGLDHVKISGRYYSRVYEGDFRNTGTWCKDFEYQADAKNFKTGKMYMWYTTCPKCAKKYGKNYVVILAEVL